VEPGAAEDQFTTRVKLESVKDGSTLLRSGQGMVYTGYSWRGRSKATGAAAGSAPDDLAQEMREVLWISPDQSQAEGRWFWGAYQECGIDVKLRRAGGEPALIGIDLYSLKTGSKAQRVRLIGDNFPRDVAPADLEFGAGVKVGRIVSHTPAQI